MSCLSPRNPKDLEEDLIDLCRETVEHLRGVDLEEFLESKALQRAIERTLELIGEAANQLGENRPKIDVPWDQITRLRIVLAHVYHKVEPRILFQTATHEVPRLLRAMERHQKR